MQRIIDAGMHIQTCKKVILTGCNHSDLESEEGVVNCENGCSLEDDIVLATFEDGFSVEDAISTVRRKTGKNVKGGVNFEIIMPSNPYNNDRTNSPLKEYSSEEIPIATDYKGEKVIAIIDTGLDIHKFQKEEFELFRTSELNKRILGTEYSMTEDYGCNFIESEEDLSDPSLHGTLVTKNLLKNLQKAGISDFQILPLKVFNTEGAGSYWNIVRAFDYLKKLRSLKIDEKNIDLVVVNASFGALEEGKSKLYFSDNSLLDEAILKGYVDALEDSSIVVASAGNEANDNDQKSHFPSNYISQVIYGEEASANMLAVAGHTASEVVEIFDGGPKSDLGSNFGRSSVNIAAPWEYPLITSEETVQLSLEGTSYSTSYLSSQILDFIVETNTHLRGSALLKLYMSEKDNANIQVLNELPIKGGIYLR